MKTLKNILSQIVFWLTFGLTFMIISKCHAQNSVAAKAWYSYNTQDSTSLINTRSSLQTLYGNTGGFYFNKITNKWRVWNGSAWVDLFSAPSLATANNGLSVLGSNIQLGGPLIKNTDISGGSTFDFTVGYLTTPVARFIASATGTVTMFSGGSIVLSGTTQTAISSQTITNSSTNFTVDAHNMSITDGNSSTNISAGNGIISNTAISSSATGLSLAAGSTFNKAGNNIDIKGGNTTGFDGGDVKIQSGQSATNNPGRIQFLVPVQTATNPGVDFLGQANIYMGGLSPISTGNRTIFTKSVSGNSDLIIQTQGTGNGTANSGTVLLPSVGVGLTQPFKIDNSGNVSTTGNITSTGNFTNTLTTNTFQVNMNDGTVNAGSITAMPFSGMAFSTFDPVTPANIAQIAGIGSTLSIIAQNGARLIINSPVPIAYISGSNTGVISNTLRTTATLDFPSQAAGTSSTLTVNLTGAVVGDLVVLGIPNTSMSSTDGRVFAAWVSATGVISVKFTNTQLSGSIDPASGNWSLALLK